jgi:transposase
MKLRVFCFDLPQSDACFIKAYPAETTEAFLDGHVSAGVFQRRADLDLYDNLKIAVARIFGDGKRQCTRAFTELVSHSKSVLADRGKATTKARSNLW